MDDVPHFTQGIAPVYTYQQRRERYERRRRERKRQRERERETEREFTQKQSWFLLPCQSSELLTISLLSGDSFFQKRDSLEGYDAFFPRSNVGSSFIEQALLHKKKCRALLERNQALRWILKPFLVKCLLKRFKSVNETDFITLSPILVPVYLKNFQTRSSYLFEAASIANEIHKKLIHHEGEIPKPISPRNPYTNTDFTLSELLSIYLQCKSYGKTTWAIETFVKANMNISQFFEYQRKPLRIHAIRSILRDIKDWDGMDLLLNFIECHHIENESRFRKALYRWSLFHLPDEPRIRSWRRLCYEYYENTILADDTNQQECLFYIAKAKSGELCTPPYELEIKMKYIRKIS